MIRPKKKRPACRRHYLREADEIPQKRDVFPWKPHELVLDPNPVRRPPPVERQDNT